MKKQMIGVLCLLVLSIPAYAAVGFVTFSAPPLPLPQRTESSTLHLKPPIPLTQVQKVRKEVRPASRLDELTSEYRIFESIRRSA